MKSFCITFAGPAGCSKSPVAFYLSCQLGLPILASDAIRFEIKEDHRASTVDKKEFDRRLLTRIDDLVARRVPFIYDASVDRHWPQLPSIVVPAGYEVAVISFDLSPEAYRAILIAKGYTDIAAEADRYLADHQRFLERYHHDVLLHINDQTFSDRLSLALRAVQKFLADKNLTLR